MNKLDHRISEAKAFIRLYVDACAEVDLRQLAKLSALEQEKINQRVKFDMRSLPQLTVAWKRRVR